MNAHRHASVELPEAAGAMTHMYHLAGIRSNAHRVESSLPGWLGSEPSGSLMLLLERQFGVEQEPCIFFKVRPKLHGRLLFMAHEAAW